MILLRHGQSEFNRHYQATGQDPGIPDAPLTPLGQTQAEAAAEALAGEDIRRILCSPFTRALQTAAPVARRLGLPVTVTAEVRERRAASCDIGTAKTVLVVAWPDLDFSAIDDVWWPAQDEAHESFAGRVAAFQRAVSTRSDWAHTLVVCHSGFIHAVTGRPTGNGEWLRCWLNTGGRLVAADP